MKNLTILALFLSAFIALPVAAKGLATVEKIQTVEENAAAKTVTVVRTGKETAVSENEGIESNDVLNTADKAVTLKTQNGSVWSLGKKTRFSMQSAQDDKVVYVLLEGTAEYKAADKSGEAVVKINDKSYAVSAGGKANFSYDTETTFLTVISGTVKFGKQVFDSSKTMKIDAKGNATIMTTPKTRGLRG